MKILFIINQPPDLARESMIQIHNFQLISIKNTFYREREQAENSKSEKSKLVTFPRLYRSLFLLSKVELYIFFKLS